MIVARRVYLYGIAFASVWMLVSGVGGLLEIAFKAVLELLAGPLQIFGASLLADEVSFYGSLTGIGLLVWAIHWALAARALRQHEVVERRSAIRKLYLYGVLLVGGVLLLYQLRMLFLDLLGVMFGTVSGADFASGTLSSPLAMVLTAGVLWAYHARIAALDRAIVPETGAGATIRRWCVYLLALIGLMLLVIGTVDLVTRLIDFALPSDAQVIDPSGDWLALETSGPLASMLTGLLVWLPAWIWSTRRFAQETGPDPERDSVLRKVYLYGVLLIAVSWTVWNLGQMLYVALRSLLIPSEAGALWSSVQEDFGGAVTNVAIYGLAWAYHGYVIRREAQAATEVGRQATIRWIYGYLVALVGGITFGGGVGGTLATVLDLLFQPGTQTSEYWWQEQLSLYATLIVVGLPVWLIPWLRLQREAVDGTARRSLARRIYLFLILGLTVLGLLGTGAYTLYQVLRVILGDRWTASDTSDL
ncbi:MAG: DUF5671 domain-containing protein, partial [Chloroflexota bacterium]